MTTSPVAIAAAEQAKAAHPRASVWVSASAGSGKTKVLTDRVLALLLAGVAPERILCLTFTKAAAAEMSNRVAARLAGWATKPDDELDKDLGPFLDPDDDARDTARRLFARVLDAPGGLHILTIHAFCQSVLRRFPLEAGVAPQFAVMDERDSAEALAAAQDETIAATQGSASALAAALGVITTRVHETKFTEVMQGLIAARGKLGRALERHGTVDRIVAATRRVLDLSPADTAESIIAAACAAPDDEKLRRAIAALLNGAATDKKNATAIGAWITAPDRRTGFDAYCAVFLTQQDVPRTRLATKGAIEADAGVLDVMLAEAERLMAVKQKLKAAKVLANTEALLRLGEHMLRLYRDAKARRGLLDYDDLIVKTRQLLERPNSAAWVLYKLDGGIDHVLIDEAQDTNPEQWAIVKALTAEFFTGEGRYEARSEKQGALVRTVFAVGDPKQSIYSFQGADPAQFDLVRDHLSTRAADAGRDWRTVALNVSFRSTEAVLEAVDTVFRQDAAREGVADEAVAHIAARTGYGGLVEIWPPLDPATRASSAAWKPPVERTETDSPSHRLAALIAARIAHMIETREILEAKGRSIRPGDIMVLVRRRTGFVKELVRQLKLRAVAVAGVDRMRLTEQLAVMDLIALGEFLLLPDDNLTLATVLKGPLIGLTEDELFTLAHDRGPRTLWAALLSHAGAASRLGQAQDLLQKLLGRTDYLSPAELYGHVLVALGGRKKLVARLGTEAEDPIDEFVNLALAYQRQHVPSLQGFLHWLRAGDIEIKRDLDQGGADAVRVITAHGAKGLQAPIVFLPDTCQTPTQQERLLWTHDDASLLLWAPAVGEQDPVTLALRERALTAQEQEYRRLLYVGMTRAEDRLYICGWHTHRGRADGSWYSLMKEGLSASPRLQPVADPFFASVPLFNAGDVHRMTSPQRVAVEPKVASEAFHIPVPLPAWARTDPHPEPTPPQPLAPSTAVRADPPSASPLREDGVRRFQRGIVIHRLLQSLPEIPPARRQAAAEALAARPAWDLDAAARADVVRETLAVIDAPQFAVLFAPGSKAEVPLTGMVRGHVISAQVDRLAVTETEVVIVDYKTNRPPATRSEDVDPAYVMQMAVYRAALMQIYPRHRVRCVLLWTDGPFILELSPAQLDAALTLLP